MQGRREEGKSERQERARETLSREWTERRERKERGEIIDQRSDEGERTDCRLVTGDEEKGSKSASERESSGERREMPRVDPKDGMEGKCAMQCTPTKQLLLACP